MKFGISTSVFWKSSEKTPEHIAKARRAGFEIIELDLHNTRRFIGKKFVDELRAVLSATGITVQSVHLPYQHAISDGSEKNRLDAVEDIKRSLGEVVSNIRDFCADPLTLVVHPGISAEKLSREAQAGGFALGVEALARAIPREGFVVAFENMLSSHFGSTPDEISHIVKKAGESMAGVRTGVCFDSCHCAYDYRAHEFLEKIAGIVVGTHLSDNYSQPDGEFHAVPMTLMHSRIDWRRVAALLAGRIETMILEISKPPGTPSSAYLAMARIAAEELAGFAESGAAAKKIT